MTNVPEIRFKGFTDAWEQRKLNSVFAKIRNAFVGIATPFYVGKQDGYFYLQSNNVKDGQINRDTEIFINQEFYEKQKDKLLKTGDLVMVQSGHVGHTAVITEELNNSAAHALIMFNEPNAETDSFFLNFGFQSTQTKKRLDTISTGNTIRHILASEMNEFDVAFPTRPEQTAIGNFFRTLDYAITLHKRKLDGLRKLKKGYLQRMFPQSGEVVPKVRFEGFSEPWHIKKISELVTLTVREVPKPTEPYKRISVRSHAKGTFHQIVDDPSKVAMDSLYVVHENDLIVNITFAWEHAIAIAAQQDHGLLVSHRFPTYVIDKSDANFLRILVTQEAFRQKLELISPGGAGRNRVLNKGDFANLELVVPSTDEQVVIGMFFNALDKQIVNCIQKIEQLIQLKSAYLQKMFV